MKPCPWPWIGPEDLGCFGTHWISLVPILVYSQWSSMIINDHWGNPSMHQPWLSCTIMTCSPCGSERATSPTLQKSVVHGEAAMHIWCLLYLFLYLPILDLPLENGLFQLKAAANHKITSLCTTKKGFKWTPLQIDSSASKLHDICVCVLLRSSTCQFYPSFCYVLSGTLYYFIQMSVFV